MVIRMRMSEKEVVEARIAGIPYEIIGKMSQGQDLSEKEKLVVRSKGKIYVLGHTKDRGQTRVKPQLRGMTSKQYIREAFDPYEHLTNTMVRMSTITTDQRGKLGFPRRDGTFINIEYEVDSKKKESEWNTYTINGVWVGNEYGMQKKVVEILKKEGYFKSHCECRG